MTHPHDNPARAELRALDQQRADTLADALRPDAAPTGDDAEVLRLREECARLRAIIAGRTLPPTAAEIAAHVAAGGSWAVTYVRTVVVRGANGQPHETTRREAAEATGLDGRWWALAALVRGGDRG